MLMSWWGIWNYRDLDWTFVRFLMFLSPSGPLLFVAYSLVPDNSERIASWREHFYSVRKQVFAASALFFLLLIINQSVLESIPALDVRRIAPALLFAAMLVGIASRAPSVQAAVLVTSIAVFAALFVSITLLPFIT
jgi:hypothetical protein